MRKERERHKWKDGQTDCWWVHSKKEKERERERKSEEVIERKLASRWKGSGWKIIHFENKILKSNEILRRIICWLSSSSSSSMNNCYRRGNNNSSNSSNSNNSSNKSKTTVFYESIESLISWNIICISLSLFFLSLTPSLSLSLSLPFFNMGENKLKARFFLCCCAAVLNYAEPWIICSFSIIEREKNSNCDRQLIAKQQKTFCSSTDNSRLGSVAQLHSRPTFSYILEQWSLWYP